MRMYGLDLKNGYWFSVFFFVIFLKIHVLCISFGLVELQREAFMLWHEEESEQIESMEKKSFGESEQTAVHTICF